MKKEYKKDENVVDFHVQKSFYGYSHHCLTGDVYGDPSNNVGFVELFGAPSGNNSAISILNEYNKELVAYSFGGVSTFDIYLKGEKSEYKDDMRKILKKVEGLDE